MQTNYLLLGLISFSGLIAGLIMALMAKEELKPGKNYFLIMQKAIPLIIAALIAASAQPSTLLKVAAIITAITLTIIGKNEITCAFLAAALWLTSTTTVAALIFIYWLPTAALMAEENPKKNKIALATQLLTKHLPYIATLLVLSLL